jgi:putative endonuclease
MPYFVYILECADKTLYCGYTNDLEKRVFNHNNAKTGAKYTMGRRPVKLIYKEEFETLSEALKREYAVKKLSKSAKMELVSNCGTIKVC